MSSERRGTFNFLANLLIICIIAFYSIEFIASEEEDVDNTLSKREALLSRYGRSPILSRYGRSAVLSRYGKRSPHLLIPSTSFWQRNREITVQSPNGEFFWLKICFIFTFIALYFICDKLYACMYHGKGATNIKIYIIKLCTFVFICIFKFKHYFGNMTLS